mmetsp:Transcript_79689/g.179751  ORF Transcript_79689/g.179751 Transcript_79689/m.179751 type:complete len:204 (+) Transcript_79689:123-734(+)
MLLVVGVWLCLLRHLHGKVESILLHLCNATATLQLSEQLMAQLLRLLEEGLLVGRAPEVLESLLLEVLPLHVVAARHLLHVLLNPRLDRVLLAAAAVGQLSWGVLVEPGQSALSLVAASLFGSKPLSFPLEPPGQHRGGNCEEGHAHEGGEGDAELHPQACALGRSLAGEHQQCKVHGPECTVEAVALVLVLRGGQPQQTRSN